MRKSRFELPICFAALTIAATADASPGTIALSWSGCNAPVVANATAVPGSINGLKLFAYVTG